MRARGLRQSQTDAERSLWNALRDRRLGGYKFRRQRPIGRFFADFVCLEAMLVVELDGGQHFEPEAMKADGERTAAIEAMGFQVLRFNNRQVLIEEEGVLNVILDTLHRRNPHPNPLPQAGEGAVTEGALP